MHILSFTLKKHKDRNQHSTLGFSFDGAIFKWQKTPKQNPIIIIAGFKFLLKVLFIGQKQ